MNTKYLPTRYIIYLIIILLTLSSCQQSATQATRESIIERARFTVDGIQMSAGYAMSNVAGDLWAIAKVTEGARGAILMYDEAKQMAVFLSEGGKQMGGVRYWFAGIVDVRHNALLDAGRAFRSLGIDIDDVTSLDGLKTALRLRGFTQFCPESLPILAASVRLGLGFLRTLGGTLSDIMAVPVGALTPEMLNPFCWDGSLDCDYEPNVY